MAVLMANYGAKCGGWKSAGGSAIWSNTGTLMACGPSHGEAVIVSKLEFKSPNKPLLGLHT